MKKNIFYFSIFILGTLAACKKDSKDDPASAAPSPDSVLVDFAAVLAQPNYNDIKDKAELLNSAIVELNANPNTANLIAAQLAWRAVRIPWEQAEGYLFGPAEDFNYDPATDTWPVNTTELDSLLSSTNPLEFADIEQLQYSLKGYHPIEYVLFGVGGTRIPSELSMRHLKYVVSLSQSLDSVTTQLATRWNSFATDLTTAGIGSTRYSTRKDAFITIVRSMQRICDEVANGKMEEPFVNQDSTLVESQYAHNATIDFTNNIIGIENAYFTRYNGHYGSSLHDMVNAINSALDNAIQMQITAAISSLQTIDPNYGIAIMTQQGQILSAQQSINELKDKLIELGNFVEVNITN
jgi:putative iron-regulated protein